MSMASMNGTIGEVTLVIENKRPHKMTATTSCQSFELGKPHRTLS